MDAEFEQLERADLHAHVETRKQHERVQVKPDDLRAVGCRDRDEQQHHTVEQPDVGQEPRGERHGDREHFRCLPDRLARLLRETQVKPGQCGKAQERDDQRGLCHEIGCDECGRRNGSCNQI